jgi:hypothetical protein
VALTADIVAFAAQYGRYGCLRIAAMLETAVGAMNVGHAGLLVRCDEVGALRGERTPLSSKSVKSLEPHAGACHRSWIQAALGAFAA